MSVKEKFVEILKVHSIIVENVVASRGQYGLCLRMTQEAPLLLTSTVHLRGSILLRRPHERRLGTDFRGTKKHFSDQMTFLRKNFRFITVKEFLLMHFIFSGPESPYDLFLFTSYLE